MIKIPTDQNGFTLIELLVTLAISAIVSTVIYSVFATGISLYQKIQLEGQLRDDADYIATMILNEMYDNSPKMVEVYENGSEKGITLTRAADKKVDQYLVEEDAAGEKKIEIFFSEGKLYIKRQLPDETIEIETPSANIDPDKSSITLGNVGRCNELNTKCTSGTIQLNLVLRSDEGIAGSLIEREPLELKSTFGF